MCFSCCWAALTLSQAPRAALQASRLGVDQELGRDTARTAGPDRPKECPTPHSFVLSDKTWGELAGEELQLPEDRLGISKWVVNNCIIHLLFRVFFIIVFLSFFIV